LVLLDLELPLGTGYHVIKQCRIPYSRGLEELVEEICRFIAFSFLQKLHVHLTRRQMMHKVAVVFFLSHIARRITPPVPLSTMETNAGAHLMLFTVDNGLIVVRKEFVCNQKNVLFL